MALAKDLVSTGFSPGQAKGIGGQVASAVSAAGTVITDATDLVASVNRVSTVASGAGVQLTFGEIGDSQWVYNGGANPLKVYPPSSSHTINQLSAGTAVTLPQYTYCVFHLITSTIVLANMSA